MRTINFTPIKEKSFLNPQLTKRLSFINRTGTNVVVAGRDGIASIIPTEKRSGARNRKFYVSMFYEFSHDVAFDVFTSTVENEEIRKSLKEVKNNGRGKVYCATFEIDLDLIMDGDAYYSSMFDIRLSVNVHNTLPPHPHTGSACSGRLSRGAFDDDTLVFRIMYVSNANIGSRYIKLGNEPYKVPIIKSDGIPEGIYVSANGDKVNDQWYANPEDCPIELFNSREAALDSIAADVKLRDQLATEKANNLKLQTDICELQAKFDDAKIKYDDDIKSERNSTEHERRLREEDAARWREFNKARVETVTSNNKYISEYFKIIPPVVGVATLLLTLLKGK